MKHTGEHYSNSSSSAPIVGGCPPCDLYMQALEHLSINEINALATVKAEREAAKETA